MTRMFARPVNILNIYQFLWSFANQHSRVIHIEQHTEPVPVLLAFCVIWCIITGNIFYMETFLSTGKSKNRIAHLFLKAKFSVATSLISDERTKHWQHICQFFSIIRDQIRKLRHFCTTTSLRKINKNLTEKRQIFDVILEGITCLRLYFAELCLYILKLQEMLFYCSTRVIFWQL